MATFEMFFAESQRPWRARDPKAREHVGIGAFDLARRDRPDDDTKLTKLPKGKGFMQDAAPGADLVRA